MFFAATIALLISWAQAEGEIWNLVDVSSVVCPLPVNLPSNAPAFKYEVTLEKTSNIEDETPYIVSFMRKSSKAMGLTYKIVDSSATPVTVIPATKVDLQELGPATPPNCSCKGVVVPSDVAATYGTNYGKNCFAWDQEKCASIWPPETLGPWCCRQWCYSSPECPDAYASQVMPGEYFSYSACGSSGTPTTCTYKRPDPCACDATAIDRFTATMKAKFSTDYGLTCKPSNYLTRKTWDFETCATNYAPNQLDIWCCQNWCYVSSACSSALKSLNPGTTDLYWSSNVCQDDTALVATCPFKPQVNTSNETAASAAGDLCECVSTPMGADILTWNVNGVAGSAPSAYGTSCAPWDQDICHLAYNNTKHDMWCCKSWCWVNEKCPTAQKSLVWPGRYFSYSNCALDADAVSSCAYAPDACACTQAPEQLISKLPGSKNALTYGASCGAHDNVSCHATWASNANAGWENSTDNHSWCCDYWCYVPEACPIGLRSWISDNASAPTHRRRTVAYYSYQTCDDIGDFAYADPPLDQCVAPPAPPPGQEPAHRRRLPAPAPLHRRRVPARLLRGALAEESMDEDGAGPGRQLAGRRRSSRSRSGGGSYPRRRAAVARRRGPSSFSGTARRRGPSAPSTPAPRRRGASSPPRRRIAPRRRAPPRRRQPIPPRRRVPSPVSSRRRTTAMASAPRRRGSPPSPPQSYTSDRRRSSSGSYSTPAHRRRTAYGYTSRPQMMNNYNGQMPYATSYGYSGYAAYPAQSSTNVAMYALAGAAAGAVVGAGAMYAYNQAYGSDWEIHRRRRQILNGRISWCTVLANGAYRGDMMDCYECSNRYGAASCVSADGCYSSVGCSYTTASNYNRDDIESDAIIPSYYTWPLKVTFESITGGDLDTSYITGNLCPPSTAEDFQFAKTNFSKLTVFKMDLFLLLTAQTPIESVGGDASGTSSFAFHVLAYVSLGMISLLNSRLQ